MIDDKLWFVGKDVVAVLGYSDTNKAIAMHLDEDDKLKDKTASSLGQRGGWLINESGLFDFVGLKGLHKLTFLLIIEGE